MRKFHIIMHTHWDREWYFTKDETQVLLVNHMKEVFTFLRNHPDAIYILDGQSVMIDDTLALEPSLASEFHYFTQNKQLRIGPWYTQTDLIIASGESIMRNLFYGINLAEQFGEPMLIGYAPDTFGHNAQMPQIYQHFGINATFFWRGFSSYKASHSDFIWQGIDNTTIYGINLATGYQGAKYLESDPIALKNRMDKLLNVLDRYSISSSRLIMNGHDQMPIQQNIHSIMKTLQTLYPEDNFMISDFESYINDIKEYNLSTVKGDLTHTQQARIHQTISSTRMDIKHLISDIEYLIYHVLEPLSLICSRMQLPVTYPQKLIDKSLKILFGVHAHDSMGGCNSDEVNSDIKQRLLQIKSSIETQITLEQRIITSSVPSLTDNQSWLTIYNLQPQKRYYCGSWNEIITQSADFNLYHNDEKIEYLLLRQESIDAGFIDRQVAARQQSVQLYRNFIYLEIAEMEGLSINYLRVEENFQKLINTTEHTAVKSILTPFYLCKIENNQVFLENCSNNQVFANFIEIMQSGDVGDSYDYSPSEYDRIVRAKWDISRIIQTDNYQEMQLTATLMAPANENGRRRGICDTLQNFQVSLLFSNNHTRISCKILSINALQDSRLRLVFNLNMPVEYITHGIQLGKVEAKVTEEDLLAIWEKEQWHEKPSHIRRFHSHLHMQNKNYHFNFVSNDINEYEYINGSIAFTLWRSFSHLGKSNLLTRPGRPSGIEIPTPLAQLMDQQFTFNATFSLYENTCSLSNAHYDLYPLIGYQLAAYQRFNLNKPQQEMIYNDCFSLELSGAVVSAFKKAHEDKDNLWFIRLYNPTYEIITISLPSESYQSNAMEQRGKSITSVTIAPMQIKQFFIKGEK